MNIVKKTRTFVQENITPIAIGTTVSVFYLVLGYVALRKQAQDLSINQIGVGEGFNGKRYAVAILNNGQFIPVELHPVPTE